MKSTRLVILSVAVATAGLAGYLAMQLASAPAPTDGAPAPVVEQVAVDEVLVTATSLPIGSRINADAMRWQEWPENALSESFITRSARPEAMAELEGAVVRLPLFDGEPIRPEKVVDASNRIMSSLLPSGKRAVSTEISVSTSAGGFILPNDRVDVIMVRRTPDERYLTEVVLSNIRVLAIDQQIEEDPEGNRTAIGSTATLELTPEQVEVLAVAQQMADRLSLALRSVADFQESDTGVSQPGGIQLIRSGTITNVGQ